MHLILLHVEIFVKYFPLELEHLLKYLRTCLYIVVMKHQIQYELKFHSFQQECILEKLLAADLFRILEQKHQVLLVHVSSFWVFLFFRPPALLSLAYLILRFLSLFLKVSQVLVSHH